MYQYKYVEAQLGGLFRKSNHRLIIDEYTQQGWRFVQVVPTNYTGYGRPRRFDIVFEIFIDENKK